VVVFTVAFAKSNEQQQQRLKVEFNERKSIAFFNTLVIG
jgi:hypothetical protein